MLPIIIGDDFVRVATITNQDGTPYNLAGCALWFTATKRRGQPDSESTVRLYWDAAGASDGIVVPSMAAGIATVRMTPAQTELFAQGAYYYDLQIDDAAGRVATIDRGVLVAQWAPTTSRVAP